MHNPLNIEHLLSCHEAYAEEAGQVHMDYIY